MLVPEPDQLREHAQCLRAEMMFDHLDLFRHYFRTQPQKLKQFRKRLMAHSDVIGNRASLNRQAEAAIFFIIDKTALGQPADHVGNRGSA